MKNNKNKMELHKTNFSGLYYSILKSGKYSFYYTYRDPITKKPTRKKIFTRDKLTPYIEKQAYNQAIKLREVESKIVEIEKEEKIAEYKKRNEKMLTEKKKDRESPQLIVMGYEYYADMKERKRRKLSSMYSYLKGEAFDNDKRVLRAMSSVVKEEKKYYNYFEGFDIAEMQINKITHENIDWYLNLISDRRYASKTTKNVLDKAKASINFWNRKYGTNYKNPFSTYKYKVVERKMKRVLDPQGLKLLLDTCKNYHSNKDLCKNPYHYNPVVYISVLLGVITAARKSTILQIQKKDFDLKSKILYLKNIKVDNQEFVIHLDNDRVEEFKEILQDYEQEEYLIRPTKPQRKKDFYRIDQPLQDVPSKVYEIMDYLFNQDYIANRIANKDNIISYHSLRRSVATNLADRGTPLFKIKALLNHATTQQTEEYIQRNEKDIKVELYDLMTDIFND